MYDHDERLQYPVKVDSPDPIYARMLQQAIGGIEGTLPIPNSFPPAQENQKFNYAFSTSADGSPPPAGRWTQGRSLDGKGEFSVVQNQPVGEEPVLGPARPDSGAEAQQFG